MAIIPKKKSAAVEAELTLRNSLFPGAADRLWDKSKDKGFTSVPKTLPYIALILDDMSEKGKPLGAIYQILWSYTWDANAFVRLGNLSDFAFVAGFRGERGERTLRDRLRSLEHLGFIELKAHGSNPTGFVFIPNPHKVILELYAAHQAADEAERAKLPVLREETFNAFLVRALDVKALDVPRIQAELHAAASAEPEADSKEKAPTKAAESAPAGLPRKKKV